jgi:hypothetical protein
VIQDVGSDNGYIRLRDGFCSTWTKSSAQVNHSPDASNGGDEVSVVSAISVSSIILRGSPASGSALNYDAVAGPVSDFPVTMHIYVDNGTVPGQLDAGDTFIENKVENTVSDGPFSTIFFPYNANVIIQTTTSAGCIDNIQSIPNVGVLPVKLLSFQGVKTDQTNLLKWTVGENESGKSFEIEKSTDGRNFTKIASINTSNKSGAEAYSFTDSHPSSASYYRVKLVDRTGQSFYSSVIFLQNERVMNASLQLAGNPVDTYLAFAYTAPSGSLATINVYNMAGMKLYSERSAFNKGTNNITIATDGKLYTGTYVLEVINNTDNVRTKFIKR